MTDVGSVIVIKFVVGEIYDVKHYENEGDGQDK